MSRLKVVQDDTPDIQLDLTDEFGAPVDVSDAGVTVSLKVRPSGGALKATVACTKQTGLRLTDGSITTAAPYNVAGVGGRVVASCPANVFDAPGAYEAEVEITSNGGATIRTVYSILRISVRADF